MWGVGATRGRAGTEITRWGEERGRRWEGERWSRSVRGERGGNNRLVSEGRRDGARRERVEFVICTGVCLSVCVSICIYTCQHEWIHYLWTMVLDNKIHKAYCDRQTQEKDSRGNLQDGVEEDKTHGTVGILLCFPQDLPSQTNRQLEGQAGRDTETKDKSTCGRSPEIPGEIWKE
jgi:hypothetical protein